VDFETVATAQGFMEHGEPIGFEDMPKQGVFRELGLVSSSRPLATTVHSSQVVVNSEVVMESHDSALHFIATELELIATRTEHPQPNGVSWDKVRPDQFADIPFWSALRDTIERKRRPR
jgi:5-formyltetrahydrofolate cyclo-ligase